jgi:exosortase B
VHGEALEPADKNAVYSTEYGLNHMTPTQFLKDWWPILVGLIVLYAPTYYDLTQTYWTKEENIHGPMVSLAVVWLIWRQRAALLVPPHQTQPIIGGIILSFGLLLYAIGRSQEVQFLEVGSQIPTFLGILLIVMGRAQINTFWFPLLFLTFMIPLPDSIVSAITSPLKGLISRLVEESLYMLGYPIARSGVILSIGPYQLLVADACSGLNSIFSLSAMGLLYVHLLHYRNKLKNILLVISIVPIAFIANFLRVVILVLVTFYYGDAAGQGFLHGFAGMVLFSAALILVFTLDWLLSLVLTEDKYRTEARSDSSHEYDYNNHESGLKSHETLFGLIRLKHFAIGIAMVFTVFLSMTLKPTKTYTSITTAQFEEMLPKQFGDWKFIESINQVNPLPDTQDVVSETYGSLINRTYKNMKGEQIMLLVGYGNKQTMRLKTHRQEVCYASQGFTISNLKNIAIKFDDATIQATQYLAQKDLRQEAVTYWFTMGNKVVTTKLDRLLTQISYGLNGEIPDGILVRVSNLSTNEQNAYTLNENFIKALLGAMDKNDVNRFKGK